MVKQGYSQISIRARYIREQGIAETGVEGGPRVGTRVEGAEEGRCEGEEGLRDLTGLIVTSASHNIRVD